ncbi:eukaryotic translation initiation factor 5A-2-like [Ananas comosus]|uniref:Eukaryotic translation initiation factor 5A-2-like n=1 Tax=Ananas comosus TaxID=4615 RepID=A0A6P5GLG0_ANACO|nr:eukaryotic translation initiation factor 5A-2-like [Ananas comosus]XP_020106151.1 eukaryotic translation initiation factor 5A-2-like [Ananas comosus]XP_020106152.1 eukaryotic translation initiation factor 5A-2-like [Ananas comosus]XP_020106153.1 eukaryotic translation initiation factor 5A-2-like [Ananas comosus]XP_020106154.1 eukaryotic translation initiation factor 5A-2-like [Ananas comosus]XP_020106155.1 eukaryotic translation initiation factor 5A-2-like [Ananas comosus]XP_020106157.1 eu
MQQDEELHCYSSGTLLALQALIFCILEFWDNNDGTFSFGNDINQVSLLTENGNTKDDLRLPTDESLLMQIKDGFVEGKDLVVSVMSTMGEEQICSLKDIGPK